MIDNFIFSISIVIPIFLVMLTGYILKKKKIVGDGFVKAANKLIFNIALPIKLFCDVMKTSISEYFDIKFTVFVVMGTILSVIFIWILGLIFIREKSKLGAFIHSSFRGNFLYIGLSIMENITGSIGNKAPLVLAFVIPLYNILAVIVLTVTDTSKGSNISIKKTLLNIVKNPLIISILAGIVASQFKLDLPIILTRTMGYFEVVVTPLALITIGATFSLQKSVQNLFQPLLASMLKLVILPSTAVFCAHLLGFSNEDILLTYILFGVPTSLVSYIMTAAMNGDEKLSSNIIMTTTLLSIFTMTGFVFIFKTIGIV